MSLSAKRKALARIHGRYQNAPIVLTRNSSWMSFAPLRLSSQSRHAALEPPVADHSSQVVRAKLIYDPVEVLPVLKPVWAS